MNIRKTFIIFSILLAIVSTCVSTIICIINFHNKNIEIIKQNIITVANDQSRQLESFFSQNLSNLNVVANIPITKQLLIDSNNKINFEDIKYNANIINQLLSSRQKEHFYLKQVSLINKDGVEIASSDSEYKVKNIVLSEKEKEKLLNNKTVVTDITERQAFDNGIKSAVIASPIFFDNQYQGSMFCIIDMSYFQRIVNEVHFFENGKVVIIDRNGSVASSNDKEIKYNVNRIKSSNDLYSQWKKIDFDNNPNGIIEYNVNGINMIGYYSRISDTGWIVLSEVEWAEFKVPLNENIRNIIIILLFILITAAIAYTFVINHFSKPLFKLLSAIKRIEQGDYSNRFIYNKNNEFGQIAKAFNDLINKIETNKHYIESKNRDLQSLNSNIPGGVYRNIIKNGEYVLDFLSSGCLNLFGYKKYEFKKVYGKKILDLIYEKDQERVEKEIKDQIDKYNKFNVEYRIKREDGSVIWLLDNGRVVKDKEGKVFIYSVVINITDTKISQEALRLSEERYRIIMSQTADVIYEWNVVEDTILYSGNWQEKFNSKPNISSISKKIYGNDSIHKDDFKNLSRLLNEIIKGEKYKETEIRIRNRDNEYIWCKIRASGIFDQNGNLFKVLGVIIDINKEKIEAEKLLFKAQRDSLTELYNKRTVEDMIKQCIEEGSPNENHALFIIDIDDFKSINDKMGHLVGDSVLSNVSSMFLNIFRENALIGRIGGDEFIVLVKNIDSEEVIYKKANELVKGFKTSFVEYNLNYKVSGSIGIAIYPQNGQSFNELCKNADKALYLAKNKGKDNYCIFDEKFN